MNNINELTMHKQVSQNSPLRFQPDFPGLNGVTIFAREYPIEPFLVFTEFLMDRPVFGPHPHAGISVMTYMLPDSQESFINRDSHGDFSVIEPGGLHITQAGSGIQHDEFPRETGIETHGFQIWINHADKNRLVPPKAMHAKPDEIPEVLTEQYKVRIIHGTYQGKAPAYQMVTAVTLLHIFLQPNQSIVLAAEEMAFVYLLNGSGETGGAKFSPQHLVNYAVTGNSVEMQADDNGCEFMFGSGTPHQEPITYGGPFVMTTPEQMAETRRRFARGDMGALRPYQQGE